MSITLPIIFIVLFLIFAGLFIVKQQTAVIIERFGKFNGVRHAGLNFKIPLIDRIATRMSLRIQQLDVTVETKTKDDVFALGVEFSEISIENKEKILDFISSRLA